MMTVTDDKYGAHLVHGRCNPFYNKVANGIEGQRTCHGNIVESLEPYGFTEYDVPLDTFNIFLPGHFDDEGHFNLASRHRGGGLHRLPGPIWTCGVHLRLP